MQFTERHIPPTFDVADVDDAAAELRRLQEAGRAARQNATEAEHALARAEEADRQARAVALRTGKTAKANAADKARAELEALQRTADDYVEAERLASDDLLTALSEHEDEIRRLAEERVTKARATLLKGVEALERGRSEFTQGRAMTRWLDGVKEGGDLSPGARRGDGTVRMAPPFNRGGYLGRVPRPGRQDLGRETDSYSFDEVVGGLRELADPPPKARPAGQMPVPEDGPQPLRRVA